MKITKTELKNMIKECLRSELRHSRKFKANESFESSAEDVAKKILAKYPKLHDSIESIVNVIEESGDEDEIEYIAEDYNDLASFIRDTFDDTNIECYFTVDKEKDFGAQWNIIVLTKDKKAYGVFGESDGGFTFDIVNNPKAVARVLAQYNDIKGYKPETSVGKNKASHPTLAELAKNKYQCMFGNMEWCEFVYEPETKTLIQYYYDPDDQFDYHVETEADLDIALDQALGGESGTWEIAK